MATQTPSSKQIIEYLNKRIKAYDDSRDMYLTFARQQPLSSAKWKARADAYDSASKALGYVKYFAETGEQHPDLVIIPEKSSDGPNS